MTEQFVWAPDPTARYTLRAFDNATMQWSSWVLNRDMASAVADPQGQPIGFPAPSATEVAGAQEKNPVPLAARPGCRAGMVGGQGVLRGFAALLKMSLRAAMGTLKVIFKMIEKM